MAKKGQFHDLTGKRFNRLVAIRFSHQGPGGQAFWEFLCNCGTTKVLMAANVINRTTFTCGCLRLGRPTINRTPEDIARRNKYIAIKNDARARKHAWELTEDEVYLLMKSNCALCGVEPRQLHRLRYRTCEYSCLYNGIDRIDNTIGYLPNNVRPCCITCNMAKHTKPEKNFQIWAQRFSQYQSNLELEYGLSGC